MGALLLTAALTGCAGLNAGGGASPGASPSPASPSAAAPSPSTTPSTEQTPAADSSAPEESRPAGQAGIVQISTTEFEYKTQYIETTIVLPLISGVDSAAQDKINIVFSDLMTSLKQSNSASEAESKQMTEDGYPSPIPYVIGVDFSVPYNKGGVLCVLVSDYRYLGGAHGGETRVAFTFDVNSGRELTLDDLMQKDSGYREYINGVIRKEIDARTVSDELAEIATFEDIGDQPWFYLTPEGLVFYFQQYEYFPYVAGIQEFDIPYGNLAGMLMTKYDSLEIKTVALEPGQSSLTVGGIGQVALESNVSTGYSWKYEIKGEGILELSNQDTVSSAAEGVVGAGATDVWDFRALEPGTATVIFTYSRDWETGNNEALDQTVQYTVTVQ